MLVTTAAITIPYKKIVLSFGGITEVNINVINKS
jgi:hypothetical protein